MSELSTSQWVTLHHPFQLDGMSGLHRPGTFELRVEKVSLDVSWEAYRTEYTLLLTSAGETSAWRVTAAALEALIAKDEAHASDSDHLS